MEALGGGHPGARGQAVSPDMECGIGCPFLEGGDGSRREHEAGLWPLQPSQPGPRWQTGMQGMQGGAVPAATGPSAPLELSNEELGCIGPWNLSQRSAFYNTVTYCMCVCAYPFFPHIKAKI